MKKPGQPTANDITRKILLEHPIRFPGSRLFRRNVGTFYGVHTVGSVRAALRAGNTVAAITILNQARPVICGTPGEPDCDGFVPVRIGGKLVGVRLGCEVKAAGDRLSPEQGRYRDMAQAGGCIWIEARGVEEYFEELGEALKELKG